MIRAASSLAPTILRPRRSKVLIASFATGTGIACLAAPSSLYRSDEYAKCSPSSVNGEEELQKALMISSAPSSFSLSLPDTNTMLDDIQQGCSLILPTMEALLRAARLAQTAVVMAVDYQAYFYRRKHPDSVVAQLYSFVFLHDNDNLIDGDDQQISKQQTQLEDKIDQLERNLANSQKEYVDPNKSTSKTDTKQQQTSSIDDPDEVYKIETLSERTLAKRQQKEAMLDIANQLSSANAELSSLVDNNGNDADNVHQRNAHRLLDLCRTNAGVYIKVGQHLANLDLLLPEEYIQTLSSLFDDAPVPSYEDVCTVVKEELGSYPQELFNDFSEKPIASASLACVHTAICKETGKKLAIKVQHKGLRETSKGDLFALSAVVGVAEKIFDEFTLGWVCEEMAPQLPKELDFKNEGTNSEAAAAHLKSTGLDVLVPNVLWDFTSDRVLSMEFEEGFRATDVESIDKAGICRREVAKLISSVFNSQIFSHGFVHCDPHEANVLLREHPNKKGKPQIVLVDHGLYKTLDGDFQDSYARLWKGIVMANIDEIKSACEQLGVRDMYPLLSAMLTARPFDEVVERSQTRSLDASPVGDGDEAVIRGYAQRYLKEIIDMLDIVPRQMLLIFKMQDCLRHVDMALGSPVNNLVVAGKYASKRVFESDRMIHKQTNGGFFRVLRSWLSYLHVLFRINSYEMLNRLS